MANGISLKDPEDFKDLPPEKQRVIMFKNIIEVKDDVKRLKQRKWLNTGASAGGGFMGGFVAILMKMWFWK